MQVKLNLKRRRLAEDDTPLLPSPSADSASVAAIELPVCEPVRTMRRPRQESMEERHFPPVVRIPRLVEDLCGACLLPLVEALDMNLFRQGGVFGDIGLLSSCDHCYHLECITTWTGIENSCPQCKSRYHAYAHYRLEPCTSYVDGQPPEDADLKTLLLHLCGVRVEWWATKKKDQTAEVPAETQDCCQVCGSNENPSTILVCDGDTGACQQTFHWTCLGYREIPRVRHWFCPHCLERDRLVVTGGRTYTAASVEKRQNAFLENPPPEPQRRVRRAGRVVRIPREPSPAVSPAVESTGPHPADIEERFVTEVEKNSRYDDIREEPPMRDVRGSDVIASLLGSRSGRQSREIRDLTGSEVEDKPRSRVETVVVDSRLGTAARTTGSTRSVLDDLLGPETQRSDRHKPQESAENARERARIMEQRNRQLREERRQEESSDAFLIRWVHRVLRTDPRFLQLRDRRDYRDQLDFIRKRSVTKISEARAKRPNENIEELLTRDERFSRFAKESVSFYVTVALRRDP